jgi:hypothetical protein
MRWILCLCIMGSSFYGFAPVAQEATPAFIRIALPAGHELKTDGPTEQCFSAAEYLTLIRMETMLGNLFDWHLEAKGEISTFQLALESRDTTIAGLKSIIKIHQDDREWLTLRLDQSKETIAGQSSGFRVEKYVLYISNILLGGLLVYQSVSN